MNTNLNKYLHEVFRKEVKDPVHLNPDAKQFECKNHFHDQHKKHFVLDSKYALHLDEII